MHEAYQKGEPMRPATKNRLIVLIGLFGMFAILLFGGMLDCGTIAPC